MITSAIASAFPCSGPPGEIEERGLTKREIFAAIAMHALLSNPEIVKSLDADQIDTLAVRRSDGVLNALNANVLKDYD